MAKLSRYNFELRLPTGLFLFNAVSCGLLRLDEQAAEAYRAIAAGATPDSFGALRAELLRGHMLVEDGLNELMSVRTNYFRLRFGPAKALTLVIAPTLDCNLECTYCFQSKRPDHMDRATEGAALEFAGRRLAQGFKRLEVWWYGGEPLLRIDTLERLSRGLISLCRERDAEYHGYIMTNGVLLDRATAELLKELRVEHVQFVLDGGQATHDARRPKVGGGPSFGIVTENLRQCCTIIPSRLRVTVDKTNTAAALEIFDVLEWLGLKNRLPFYFAAIQAATEACRSIDSQCHSPAEFARIEIELYRAALARGFHNVGHQLQPHPVACGAVADNQVLIGPDGTMWKCWQTIGDKGEAVGHVARPDEVLPRAYDWSAWDPIDAAECRECPVLPTCGGSCPWRWWQYHSGRSQHPPCVSQRYNLPELLQCHIDRIEQANTAQATAPLRD